MDFKPNFFLVGAPKCGTSSLYYYLKQHPDIFLTAVKEPHYFCKDFHKEIDAFHSKHGIWPLRDEVDYLDLFKTHSHEAVVGEASTSYLYSQTAATEIYNFNPDAKILIALRNPIEVLHSWHSHLLYYFEEDVWDFGKALAMEEERAGGHVPLPRKVKFPTRLRYHYMVQFDEQIKRYKELFGLEQIRIVLLDDLKNDLAQTFEGILEYLGVDSKFQPEIRIKNPSKVQKNSIINKVLNSEKARILKVLMPSSLKNTMVNKLRRLNTSEQKRATISQELELKLKETYRPQVEALSKLLSRDLVELWKYD